MKWVNAQELHNWAERLDARQLIPRLIGQLIRASATEITAYRFPADDNAQIRGWDGRLTAKSEGPYQAYVPEGDSVWEFGVAKGTKAKADGDYQKRTEVPGEGVSPTQTTFVFVTPRTWEGSGAWASKRTKEGRWKNVRVIDAVDLEEWLQLCPAAAAAFAQANGFKPETGAFSIDEYWELYSRRFEPHLREEVLLAGRTAQQKELETSLYAGKGVQRCKGDSLEEVLGFLCAVIRSADNQTRLFFESRVLIVQTEEAARQVRDRINLIFAVRGAATEAAGMLADRHRVIVPVGRDDKRTAPAIALVLPTANEMGEALQKMGYTQDKALQLAHECGKSVTVLARRISSSTPASCTWRNDAVLIPAFLAGAWDTTRDHDKAVIAGLAAIEPYEKVEAPFREYLKDPDGPLELIGSVWTVRAPVDMFAQVCHLLQGEHWRQLAAAAHTVVSEIDPVLDLLPEDRMYASLRHQVLTHSSWLRDGLVTTLLILAAMGEQNGVRIDATSPQAFVNNLVERLPGLFTDYRVIASLSRQLPMLMEAAPNPLLKALEHLLKGDGQALKPLFQDRKEDHSLWSSSPHTAVLWALELLGRDPAYLQRASLVLARLAAIDPQGTLTNRPMGSLHALFSAWHPGTNASHELRLATLKVIIIQEPAIAWSLIVGLIPGPHDFQMELPRPRFREAGASDRETLTYPILYKTVSWLVDKALTLAGEEPLKWIILVEKLNQLPPGDRSKVINAFRDAALQMVEDEQVVLWKPLLRLIRKHRAHATAEWALREEDLAALEVLERKVAPLDASIRDHFLFTERLPDIPIAEPSEIWNEVERMRTAVVQKLLRSVGIPGVVAFASQVEAPAIVGSTIGAGDVNPDLLLEAIRCSLTQARVMDSFVSAVSASAHSRFGEEWPVLLESAIRSETLRNSTVIAAVQWWPHNTATWRWVAAFGPETERSFWESRHAWNIAGDAESLEYGVTRYLQYDRPEYLIDALAFNADALSQELWFMILLAYEQRLLKHPELYQYLAAYHLQRIFKSLQMRPDVQIEQLAVLEYRYLSALRELIHSADPDSALDRYLAEKPSFFVQIVSSVFRAANERGGEKPEPTLEEAARARTGFRLLESFARLPGSTERGLDLAALSAWVEEVRSLAREADRLVITEQYIGKMLVHSPPDSEDGIWPHGAIREGLEQWQADEIERGLLVGKHNARGVTTRGPFDGGEQERGLAASFRADAKQLSAWPRTKAVLLQMAESYEREAKREDEEVEQLRRRE